MRFLKQSVHKKKNTPGVHNAYEHDQHKDGFGFAYQVEQPDQTLQGVWAIYKQPFVYSQDKSLEGILDTVVQSDMIFGHLRNKSSYTGRLSNENTHPFLYEDKVFLHNGFIHDYARFENTLKQQISKRFCTRIQGTTDSETLFYLFLTICEKQKSKETNKEEKMEAAMKKMFRMLQGIGITGLFNFMYADASCVVVTRYAIGAYGCPSLYMDGTHGKILITSEPITGDYTLFPAQSVLVMQR